MAFNIYYINYPKVYEIKMMFDNFITVAKEVQKDTAGKASAHLGAKMGLGFLKLFSGEGNADRNAESVYSIYSDGVLLTINDHL